MNQFQKRTFVLTVFILLAGLPSAARPQISMEIVGPSSRVLPIAIPELKNLGGDDQHRLSAIFTKTLRSDLELSGFFRIVDPSAYIEDPEKSGYELGQFNFADWSSINAEFVVKGTVSAQGGNPSIVAMLFDVSEQRRMTGSRFTGSPGEVAEMARRFADSILKAVTGVRGPFNSKIAFVSTRGGRFKEIYTAAPDGGDMFRVTNNPTINIFPGLDHGAGRLLYLSFKTGRPALYLADLRSRRELRVESTHGAIVGGALVPDATRIVAAIERNGYTNLHLLDGSGNEIRALTNNLSINVAPAVSPDGKMLAFTSDRSGNPQIYTIGLEGGAPRRLTYSGNYNTTPAFSPAGDEIAYQGRTGGRFDIFTIPVKGGEPKHLTHGPGSNEFPHWSPDGRYIVFSSTRTGRSRIYLMRVSDAKIISALMEGNGDDTSPAWSWWLGE